MQYPFKKNKIKLITKRIIILLFYGILFIFLYWFLSLYKLETSSSIVINILLLTLIPTHSFIIEPIKYLFNKNDFYYYNLIPKESILSEYRIKIIDKNLFNAYATGIIPFSKTILIGKQLIYNLDKNQLLSIILHEVGHLKLNHLLKLYILNLILTILSYILFYFFNIYYYCKDNLLNLLFIFLIGCFMGFLFWFIPGKVQYKFEYQADSYASNLNGKENLKSALEKLDNLSGGKVSKGGITHPKLLNRIKNIQ